MKKIREFAFHSPIWLSMGISVGFLLINILLRTVFSVFPDSVATEIIREIIYIIWPAAITVLCGYKYIYKEKGFWAGVKAGLAAYIVYGLLLLVNLADVASNPSLQWKTGPEIALGILMLIGVGFREETLFRGIIVNAIGRKYATDTKGFWFTVIISSILFGSLHMGNMMQGVGFEGAFVQSVIAMSIGMFYCAVYMRSGSFWAVAFLHTLMDASATVEVLFANGGTLATTINSMSYFNLIYVPFSILITAFLLRKSKRNKILERLEQQRSQYLYSN